MFLPGKDFLRVVSSRLRLDENDFDSDDCGPFDDPCLMENIDVEPYNITWNALKNKENWRFREGLQRFINVISHRLEFDEFIIHDQNVFIGCIDKQLMMIIAMQIYMV
jgi:hypothetical protein